MSAAWMPFLETAAGGARMPMSAKPSPVGILTNDATIAVWNSEGLPDDTVSVENGCIMTSTKRWPLMIDPQLQGITWVREREKAKGLIVVRLEHKDLLRKLEAAIEKGTPVLVENMGERIDAVWDRWLALDPVRMVQKHAETLRSMRGIYIDAGRRDEWLLDLGAEAYRRELAKIGVTDVFFELFDATHAAIEYRYPMAMEYLARRMA
jgi:hypothetical protein